MDPATHLLYVLLDSNLPTGGFVSSAGLESYAKHGFLRPPSWQVSNAQSQARPASAAPLGSQAGRAITAFTAAEVENFDSTTAWYLQRAWDITRSVDAVPDGDGVRGSASVSTVSQALEKLVALDQEHEATLLSHVGRRASKAQGIAMLTLHARSFGESELVKEYKRAVVRKDAPGHLAVAFGVVVAAIGLDIGGLIRGMADEDTARHLYLFTHVRSTLSAGVRLNSLGPYLSTQLLAGPMKGILDDVMKEEEREESTEKTEAGWEWAKDAESGPATTWPLGEILAARHDMQHSRIFNS